MIIKKNIQETLLDLANKSEEHIEGLYRNQSWSIWCYLTKTNNSVNMEQAYHDNLPPDKAGTKHVANQNIWKMKSK